MTALRSMVGDYRALAGLLQQIPNLTVIKGSETSATKDWALPAVIIDYENPTFGSLSEKMEISVTASRFSLLFHVKPSPTGQDDSLTAVEDLINCFMPLLVEAYSNKSLVIDAPQNGMMPFGQSQEAYGLGFFLTISEGD